MPGASPCSKIFFIVLFLLAHFSSCIHATIARGWDYSLGITPDAQDVTQHGNTPQDYTTLLFTTILQYDKDTAIFLTDDQLVGLAAQAYAEMSELYVDLKQSCRSPVHFPRIPVVVAAMAIGNKVYISSSYKPPKGVGLIYTILKDAKLTALLNACQSELKVSDPTADIRLRHRNDGNCAEILAIQQYLEHNNKDPPANAPKGTMKRIAAWGTAGMEDVGALHPCGAKFGRGWGCEEFLKYQGIDILDAVIEKYTAGKNAQPPKTDERPVPLDGKVNIQFEVATKAGTASGS